MSMQPTTAAYEPPPTAPAMELSAEGCVTSAPMYIVLAMRLSPATIGGRALSGCATDGILRLKPPSLVLIFIATFLQ